MDKPKLPQRLQEWVEARKRHHLSHAHVQMARELGMNPKKLGKINNHEQEPWKLPLPQFIEHLYEKRFGRPRPVIVMSIEDRARAKAKPAAPAAPIRAMPRNATRASTRIERKAPYRDRRTEP
jgi:hypothetical protein